MIGIQTYHPLLLFVDVGHLLVCCLRLSCRVVRSTLLFSIEESNNVVSISKHEIIPSKHTTIEVLLTQNDCSVGLIKQLAVLAL